MWYFIRYEIVTMKRKRRDKKREALQADMRAWSIRYSNSMLEPRDLLQIYSILKWISRDWNHQFDMYRDFIIIVIWYYKLRFCYNSKTFATHDCAYWCASSLKCSSFRMTEELQHFTASNANLYKCKRSQCGDFFARQYMHHDSYPKRCFVNLHW